MNAAMLEQIESLARSPLCFWPTDDNAREWWALWRKGMVLISTIPDPFVCTVPALQLDRWHLLALEALP